jgi:SAM-dependent methyltransferase
MSSPQSTVRFSDRVADYVRYRPGYPPETLDLLRDAVGLTTQSVVADIGSGTGISTELLLRSGAEVYGVEPNDPMRAAAEAQLAANPRFHSVRGTAEATTLAAVGNALRGVPRPALCSERHGGRSLQSPQIDVSPHSLADLRRFSFRAAHITRVMCAPLVGFGVVRR